MTKQTDVAAEIVITNAKVWTVDPRHNLAQAVAIGKGTILEVGSDERILRRASRQTRRIDAAGRTVMPGFNDAHAHFIPGGASLVAADLREARDEEHFVRILRDYVQAIPSGQWVTGGRWDHQAWPSRTYPRRELIDRVSPDNPVFIPRVDGHVALANSLGLKLAGITRQSPDPPGGKIERDTVTGEPTGILIDSACDPVYRAIPEPTRRDRLAQARLAMEHAAKMGVTSVQAPCSVGDFRIFQELRRQGELSVRVYAMISGQELEHLAGGGMEAAFGDAMLRAGGVKFFADGSFGAGSALLFDPYDDDPSSWGLAIQDEPELHRLVRKADAAGLQVALHAIGDRAVHWALNAFEAAGKVNGPRRRRHRIEHAQLVRPSDRQRLAKLGVVASIQPYHCCDDMRWIEGKLGPRCETAYPYRSLVEAGVRTALGTDWPVEPLNPMLALYASVARRLPDGSSAGSWYGDEEVSIAQAVESYTLGSAYAEFQESRKGSIEPGKLADLVMLSRDLTTARAEEILDTTIAMTIADGRVVHEA